ncbi:hypothetical protein [Pseudactinotalea terrae]|uniref:hypothetical protein n=1 Tax=Pseudactinotalea terrae TaxID=1743262 RepID=UPI0012E1AC63|nr:hypothetical protein [Pseudactinotalea terrae]
MTNQKRVQPGVREGGQFSTDPRSEAQVSLTGTDHGVRVQGEVLEDGQAMVDSLNELHLGPEAVLDIDGQNRFAGDLHTAVSSYRVSAYEVGTYRIKAEGASGYSDVLLPAQHTPAELADALRKARTAAISDLARGHADAKLRADAVERAELQRPVAARRDPQVGLTEVGFALPGDHIKVRTFSEGADAQLFARSAIKDGIDTLTERQNRNRLNKVLDQLGPDRETADRVLRTYLSDVRTEADRLHAADEATRLQLGLDA